MNSTLEDYLMNNNATITIQSYYSDEEGTEYEAYVELNVNMDVREIVRVYSLMSVEDVLKQLDINLGRVMNAE